MNEYETMPEATTRTFDFSNDENVIKVEISLKTKKTNKPVFSACGRIKNKNFENFGQCLDTIKEYTDDPIFAEIHRLWSLYHLNDMHAGTEEQEQALEKAVAEGKLDSYGANNYENTCAYLKSINLYEVKRDGELYKYGHGWLYYPIPADELAKIRKLLIADKNSLRKSLQENASE